MKVGKETVLGEKISSLKTCRIELRWKKKRNEIHTNKKVSVEDREFRKVSSIMKHGLNLTKLYP